MDLVSASLSSPEIDLENFFGKYTETYECDILKEVSRIQKEFSLMNVNLEETCLYDLIRQYQSARNSVPKLRTRLKLLHSKIENNKKVLWHSVTKTVSADGKCRDGNKVTISQEYSYQVLDDKILKETFNMLTEIEKSLLSELTFQLFLKQQMKLKVDQFLYDLISDAQLVTASSVVGYKLYHTLLTGYNLNSIKESISVLFSFQRKPINDKEFLQVTRSWLNKLVSVLLYNGTLEDNLFIVNHVLRCPSGISAWACQYIQLPSPISAFQYECRYLHYILKVLYLILNPVSDRNQFLRFISPVKIFSEIPEKNVLSSDGTEENSFDFVRDWSEEDILSLLHQIPFADLFKQLLFISSPDSGLVYNINEVSEGDMLKYLEISTAVIHILFSSLENYEQSHFLQLIDAICNLAVHTVYYASYHLWNFLNANISFNCALQEEFDTFIFHTVYIMFFSNKATVWKFLTYLPYNYVSYKTLWSLLWIFYSPDANVKVILAEKEVEKRLLDESTQFIFLEKLNSANQQSLPYIFNSFQLMALVSIEINFIHFVCHQIFEASFVHEKLRHSLNKKGNSLILSIAEQHTFVISLLLKQINQKEAEVAEWSKLLFSELNFSMWIPEQEDMKIITKWLLDEPFCSIKNHLAWVVLKKMNWNYDETGKLHLPFNLHKEVAMLILKSCIKFEKEGTLWHVFKTLLPMPVVYLSNGNYPIRTNKDYEASMWQIIFSLKLHIFDQKIPPLVEIYDGFVPTNCTIDMYQDPFLRPLAEAFDMNHPQGLYLAVIMSKIGYSVEHLQDVGLLCISMLIKSRKYAAATKLLFYILPFYVKNTKLLLSHKGFISSLCDLIIAEQSWLTISIVNETDSVIHNLATIIKCQIDKVNEISIECAFPVLKLWLKLLLHLLGDHEHKSKALTMSVYFLLDVLIQIAFTNENTRDYLIDQINFTISPYDDKMSFQSSWWNIFEGENYLGSFLRKQTLPKYPWVAFYLLLLETRQFYKEIWNSLLKEITKNELLAPSIALKNASTLLNKKCPPLNFLPIYRWVFQIIDTPVAHPSFFLLCQQFFLCYFQRVSTRSCNIPEYQSRSIGDIFFADRPFALLFKKLKAKLKEVQAHYTVCYKQVTAEVPNCLLSKAKQIEKIEFLGRCNLTLKAFCMWIDEGKRLSKPNISFSALISFHDVEKLKLIFENDQRLWFELVLILDIEDEIVKRFPCLNLKTTISDKIPNNVFCNHWELIARQLQSYKSIKQLLSEPLNPPVENINHYVLNSYDALAELVKGKQHSSLHSNLYFTNMLNNIKKLNAEYTNLLPQEYIVKDIEIKREKYCHRSQIDYPKGFCLGPALIRLDVKNCYINKLVQNRCLKNRIEYDNFISGVENSPFEKEIIITSIFMEKCTRDLVKLITTDISNSRKLVRNGVLLFYLQIKFINDHSKSSLNYVPLQQFWALSSDLLGKTFIEGNVNECLNLTRAIINYPSAGSFISSFFDPHIAPPSVFVQIYEILTCNVRTCSPNTLFVLLSKINLKKWLNDEEVRFSDSTMLFKKLCQALYLCKIEDESLLLVYQIFRNHFCLLFVHKFPLYYSDAVQFLLTGVEKNSLCVDIWYEVLHCLGFSTINENSTYENIKNIFNNIKNDSLPSEEQSILLAVKFLSAQQILKSLEAFHIFVFNMMRSSISPYKKFSIHTKPIGIFLTMLVHLLVQQFLKGNTVSLNFCSEGICDIIQITFQPYIYPIEKEPYLKFPWSLAEEKDALFMFKMFALSLEYLHKKLVDINCDRSVLSYVWEYYYSTYGKNSYINSSPDVCHIALRNIPWNDFYPQLNQIQEMHFVLQSRNHKNIAFVSNIIMSIPWQGVIAGLDQTTSPNYIRRILLVRAELFIICGYEDSVDKNCHKNNCEAAENFSWHYLTVGDVEKLLTLYYHHSDPVNMLINKPDNIPDIYVLRFLKFLCSMLPQNTIDPNSSNKRLLFIKKYIDALCFCITEKNELYLSNLKNIFNIVPSLFDDVELVILKDTPSDLQFSCSIPLLQEVFRFPNFISDENKKNEFLKLTVAWLKDHMQSPLLLPCINAACSTLTSISFLVSVVECCIEIRFHNKLKDPSEACNIWNIISSFYQVPIVLPDDYVDACVEKNLHLSFFIYILHQIPRCQATDDKIKVTSTIVDYIKRTNLDEDCESKVLLLWDKLLDLCLSLSQENEVHIVCNFLLSFCQVLTIFGVNRTDKGILAFIGLGRPSQLSVKFRFLCRAMAAFLLAQMPKREFLRLYPMASGFMNSAEFNVSKQKSGKHSSPPTEAVKAVRTLFELRNNSSFSMLQDQFELARKSIMNPKMCFLDCRQLLKRLALYLYPDVSYLHLLDK